MLAASLVTAGAVLMTAATDTSNGLAVKQRLQAIASSRVLFGHQSVGGNVLEGLRTLAKAEGVELRIAEVKGAADLQAGTLGHLLVGTNGDPRGKLASFQGALGAGDPDVALVKFCYVDFNANTDAKALLSEYEATLRGLQARHPRTTFVHVTAPLVADDGFVKWLAKKLLRKTSGAVASNARREEYNALLRAAFPGEPLFDLARIESTDSSGQQVAARFEGKTVPMLASEYTDDGGHLNAAGSLQAALALVDVLGNALLAPGRSGAERSRNGVP